VGVRTLLLVAKLLFVDLASAEDTSPAGQAFLFLGHADKAAVDQRPLLDAVAIYTRDLGITLLQAPGTQPPSVSPPALDEVVALLRSRGARLAFWCQLAPGGRQIDLVTVDLRRSVTRHSFELDGASRSDLYRSIALRLRAILVGAEPAEAGPDAAPAGTPPTPSPAAPVKTPIARAPQGDAAIATRPAPKSAPAPERTVASRPVSRGLSPDDWPRMFFGAGYALSYPLDTSVGAAARHALALDVMVATHGHLEWDFGADLAPSAEHASTGATLSVMDIPLRLGGRWVHPIRAVTLAGGPFVGLHWLSANASAGMQTDQRTALGGAAGIDVVARAPSLAGFAVQLRVWAEANVPRTRFTIKNVPSYDAGAMRLGLDVEIVAPVP